MRYAVREREAPEPIVYLDLAGKLEDDEEQSPSLSGEPKPLGRYVSMELGSLLEALITAGQRFIVVNGSRLESLGSTCAMALCAYAPRLARAGGALVCCSFPHQLSGVLRLMPTLYATTEEEAVELCRPGPLAEGSLWPSALQVTETSLEHEIAMLSLVGAYWSGPAYAELHRAVRATKKGKILFEASGLTAVAPKAVGPLIKLVKELQSRKVPFAWCRLTALPGSFLSGTGLMNIFPYFETVEQATAALQAATSGAQEAATVDTEPAETSVRPRPRPAAAQPAEPPSDSDVALEDLRPGLSGSIGSRPGTPTFEEEPLEIEDLDDAEHFNKLRTENPARNLTERYLYFSSMKPELTRERFGFVRDMMKKGFTTLESPRLKMACSVGWWYSHSYPELILTAAGTEAGMETLVGILRRVGKKLQGIQPVSYQVWVDNPSAFLAPRIEHLDQLVSQAVKESWLQAGPIVTASPDFLARYPYTYGWEFYLQFADESLVPLVTTQAR